MGNLTSPVTGLCDAGDRNIILQRRTEKGSAKENGQSCGRYSHADRALKHVLYIKKQKKPLDI